jgi:hypothetical protein
LPSMKAIIDVRPVSARMPRRAGRPSILASTSGRSDAALPTSARADRAEHGVGRQISDIALDNMDPHHTQRSSRWGVFLTGIF